jgi:hypothetical protein
LTLRGNANMREGGGPRIRATDRVRKIARTPCQGCSASQGDFAHPTALKYSIRVMRA